jgi:DNA-binding response OmpR family regulator
MNQRILLVTSNPVHVRFLREHSSISEFRWTVVEQLKTALERLRHEAYDLALLALTLKDSRGRSNYQKMHEASPDMAIIVLARPDEEEQAIATLKDGAEDYIVVNENPKPISLRSVIQNAIRRKDALAKLRRSSLMDEPTGFYNVLGFTQAVKQQLKAGRAAKRRLRLVLMRFDTEARLPSAAGVVRETLEQLRQVGCVARTQDDELAILLPDMDPQALTDLVHRNARSRLTDDAYAVASVAVDPESSDTIQPYLEQARMGLSVLSDNGRSNPVQAVPHSLSSDR